MICGWLARGLLPTLSIVKACWMQSFSLSLEKALLARGHLLTALESENTDCYRVLHGISEGYPGLTVDRYGSLILVQSFREGFSESSVEALREAISKHFPYEFIYVDRTEKNPPHHSLDRVCREFGFQYWIRAKDSGVDPGLFLDLRSGRRVLKKLAAGKSVLNLFSYTGSAGVVAAKSGAKEVVNVDFSKTHLDISVRNAELNGIPKGEFKTIEEDCIPVMRQFAGLSAGGRFGKTRRPVRLNPRQFDLIFLDPPTWSRGAFGAVDINRDYATLFKPCVLMLSEGGAILATHHSAELSREVWVDQLNRCAEKAGRPIRELTIIDPDADFPSFDGSPPLKIALCHF